MTIRLDKYLASKGYCSRRGAEAFLSSTNVTLNGQRVKEHGTRFDLTKDSVQVGGKNVEDTDKRYYIVNKPINYVSTVNDEHNRKTVLDLLPKNITDKYRLYPVGRLDHDSEGLVLLTNDGDLTHKLTHPKSHVPKIYEVVVKGNVKAGYYNMIRRGIKLKNYITSPAEVKKLPSQDDETRLELTLFEGKNRQIRRMCKSLNLHLVNLQRVGIGSISLDNLKLGGFRELSVEEVKLLSE